MPDVHVLGKIKGAAKFGSFRNLSLVWRLVIEEESGWYLLQGPRQGRTHIDTSWSSETKVWDHPLDIHLATTGALESWPKLQVEVWSRDDYGRDDIVGYGACFLPTEPGEHHLEAVTWRPKGGFFDELSAFFLGGFPRLLDTSTVSSGADRFGLETVTSGVVYLSFEVVHAGLEAAGILTQQHQTGMDL